MKITNLFKALTLAAVFTLPVLMFIGCGPAKVSLHETDLSKQGVALENYLPEDTLMYMSANLADSDQKNKFQNLLAKFPQEEMGPFFDGILEEISAALSGSGIEFKDDLAPAFGDDFKVIFSMAGPLGPENPEDDPTMYIAFTLNDTDILMQTIDKMIAEKEGYVKGEQFGEVILDNDEEPSYAVIFKDTLLITNKKEARHDALKRMKNNENSVLNNDQFKTTYNNLPQPNLGYAYINVSELITFASNIEEVKIPADAPFIKALFTEAFVFIAENDGLKMIVDVAFDPNNKDFNINDIPYREPYLLAGMPGEKLIMYSESSGLNKAFDIQMAALDEDSQKEFRKAELLIKKTVGIDLHEDVLSWMDRGYALAVQRNNSIIPAISLLVDAQSNPEGAQKIVDLLDAAFTEAVEGMKADAPAEIDTDKFIRKDKVTIGKSEINRVSFDFSTMTDDELKDAGLPSGVFTEPIEFFYGLTAKNYFILSTLSGLNTKMGSEINVDSVEELKEARSYLKDYPYGISYISVGETVKYIDDFITVIETVQGPMDKDFTEGYAKLKNYLAPVKYITAGNKKLDNIAEALLFVKMD